MQTVRTVTEGRVRKEKGIKDWGRDVRGRNGRQRGDNEWMKI